MKVTKKDVYEVLETVEQRASDEGNHDSLEARIIRRLIKLLDEDMIMESDFASV